MQPKTQGQLALFGVALIYGANYSIAKIAMADPALGPNAVVCLRLGFGALMFALLDFFFPREKLQRRDIWLFVLCSFLGATGNQLLFFHGINLSQPINASIIMTMLPVFTLIISAGFKHEHLHWMKIVGIILGAIGTFVLIWHSATNPSFSGDKTYLGELMVFGNTVLFSFYLVLSKNLLKRYRFTTVVKWVFVFGFFLGLPFTWRDTLATNFLSLTQSSAISLAYILVFTTFMAYLLNNYALQKVPPSLVGAFVYLQPVLATIIAVLLAEDVFSSDKILPAILIFLGVGLVSFAGRKANIQS